MAEPRHPVSDIMLARYIAGDLHGAQLERIERAIKETPGVAERLARVKTDRDSFLKDHPPEAFAHRIVTRITVEKKPRTFWQVWWALPPFGVATALLIGIFVHRAVGPQDLSPAAVTTDDRVQLEAQVPEAAPPAWDELGKTAKTQTAERLAAKADKEADQANKRDEKPASHLANGEGNLANAQTSPAHSQPKGKVSATKDAPAKVAESEARDMDDASSLGLVAGSTGGGASSRGVASGPGAGEKQREFAKPPPPPAQLAQKAPAPASASAPAAQPAPAPAKPAPAKQGADGFAADMAAEEAPPPAEKTVTNRKAEEPKAEPMPEAGYGAAARSAPATVTTPDASAAHATRARLDDKSVSADAPADFKESKKSHAADSERRASSESAAVVPSSTMTIEQAGRSTPVTGNTTVMAETPIKVTARGGQWVTVVGVRSNGQPRVYSRAKIPAGGQGAVSFKLMPTSSRIAEAVFIVIGDTDPGTSITADNTRDSNKLPLRLNVDGTQKRLVINVTPSAQ